MIPNDLWFINHELKIAYTRVPKNCSSALRQSSWIRGLKNQKWDSIPQEIKNTYDFFIVLREPHERFISAWLQSTHAKFNKMFFNPNTIEEFESVVLNMEKNGPDDLHMYSQDFYVDFERFEKLENHHYVLFDGFEANLKALEEKLNLPDSEIKRVRIRKKEAKEKLRGFYKESKIAQDFVKEYYKKDLEVYSKIKKALD